LFFSVGVLGSSWGPEVWLHECWSCSSGCGGAARSWLGSRGFVLLAESGGAGGRGQRLKHWHTDLTTFSYARARALTHTHILTNTHAHIYVHTHVHTHTHAYMHLRPSSAAPRGPRCGRPRSSPPPAPWPAQHSQACAQEGQNGSMRIGGAQWKHAHRRGKMEACA